MVKGIKYLEDILDGSLIKPFRTLQLEHQLHPTEQYKHMQIDHLLKKNPQKLTLLPVKITRYYQQTSILTKGISIIYSGLQEEDICVKSQSMIAWEQEIGVEYTTQHWGKTLRLNKKHKPMGNAAVGNT